MRSAVGPGRRGGPRMRTAQAALAGRVVQRPDPGEGGFTLVELLIAMALTLLVTAALVGLVDSARGAFQSQPEISDMHQRLRVTVDALTHDLLMAGAGIAPGAAPAVVPYRVGQLASDVDTAVLYRPGVISVTYIRSSERGPTSRTYYLRDDSATDAPQLMRYDGIQTDLPVVDHVVGLDFAYFDEGQTRLDPAVLQDGPWAPSDLDVGMFDADLLRIRRLRVTLRVEAALAAMRGPAGTLFTRGGTATSMGRYVPDHELQFDIALRNVDR